MKKLTAEQKALLKKIGIIVLAVLCMLALIWFIVLSKKLYKAGDLQSDYTVAPDVRIHHVHPIVTVDDIMPWMTFNYLNVVFKLPSNYLENVLGITDRYYPNIRIDSYVKSHKLNLQLFMQNVKQGITSYSAPR